MAAVHEAPSDQPACALPSDAAVRCPHRSTVASFGRRLLKAALQLTQAAILRLGPIARCCLSCNLPACVATASRMPHESDERSLRVQEHGGDAAPGLGAAAHAGALAPPVASSQMHTAGQQASQTCTVPERLLLLVH